MEYLEKRVPLDEPLRLHVTGCPNACAQYQIGHIGLLGSKVKVDGQSVDAYDVFVGGQLGKGAAFNHVILRKIPATECAKRLETVLWAFKRTRKDRESFTAWTQRIGDEAIRELLGGEQSHPLDEAEKGKPPNAPGSTGQEAA